MIPGCIQHLLARSMPNTVVHARIDRIARHVSASNRREAGATADASTMQASPDVRPPITSHALDTARGTPAKGLPLTLERRTEGGGWVALGNTTTNHDGRAPGLMPSVSSVVSILVGLCPFELATRTINSNMRSVKLSIEELELSGTDSCTTCTTVVLIVEVQQQYSMEYHRRVLNGGYSA